MRKFDWYIVCLFLSSLISLFITDSIYGDVSGIIDNWFYYFSLSMVYILPVYMVCRKYLFSYGVVILVLLLSSINFDGCYVYRFMPVFSIDFVIHGDYRFGLSTRFFTGFSAYRIIGCEEIGRLQISLSSIAAIYWILFKRL